MVLLVDNSLTMLARDFEPNRIITIKEVIRKVIQNKKENQAFSVVVFAGNSFLLCPLTKDKDQLLSAFNKLDRGIMKMKPGTNFSNAMLNGIASLQSQAGNKAMILFTDGKENVK
ncbi:VWA domain-containing protein [uncultured Chryseobacterium sp.]|uniref:vWA domain-containing protein n=1 Tax=uncultured Chryseobacterium sp. TaxID=259322 RepID=UPI00345BF1DA